MLSKSFAAACPLAASFCIFMKTIGTHGHVGPAHKETSYASSCFPTLSHSLQLLQNYSDRVGTVLGHRPHRGLVQSSPPRSRTQRALWPTVTTKQFPLSLSGCTPARSPGGQPHQRDDHSCLICLACHLFGCGGRALQVLKSRGYNSHPYAEIIEQLAW